jgi:hypothetical protein
MDVGYFVSKEVSYYRIILRTAQQRHELVKTKMGVHISSIIGILLLCSRRGTRRRGCGLGQGHHDLEAILPRNVFYIAALLKNEVFGNYRTHPVGLSVGYKSPMHSSST